MAPATEFATVPARFERVVNIAYDAPVVWWCSVEQCHVVWCIRVVW